MLGLRARTILSAAVISFSTFSITSALSYVTDEQLAHFDDIPLYRTGSQLNLYKTLYWHNFFVQHPDHDSESPEHGGLYPKSPSSDFLYPQSSMICHDTLTSPIWGAARLTTNYEGSHIALFDLRTFSFGCLELDPTTRQATTKPIPCAVGVKGYTPGRGTGSSSSSSSSNKGYEYVKPSLEMTLWFTNSGDEEPTESTKMRMVHMDGLDKSWWALGAVTFEAVADGPAMLCLDDVSYRTYNVTKWGKTFAAPEHVLGRGQDDLR